MMAQLHEISKKKAASTRLREEQSKKAQEEPEQRPSGEPHIGSAEREPTVASTVPEPVAQPYAHRPGRETKAKEGTMPTAPVALLELELHCIWRWWRWSMTPP